MGGKDGGFVNSFFDNNFDLPALSLSGANTYGFLTDWINNGNRSSDEALYVDALFVGAGSNLKPERSPPVLNGYGQVFATNDWFNGHGRIIDNYIPPVPVPSSLLLLASAFLGLAGWRNRKQ